MLYGGTAHSTNAIKLWKYRYTREKIFSSNLFLEEVKNNSSLTIEGQNSSDVFIPGRFSVILM